jgi:hypothetical protein
MTFTNSSNDNELSKPLLDNPPQHESDEEQGRIPGPSLTLAIVYDDEGASGQKAAEDERQWWGNFVGSIVLPTILFLQFSMAFYILSSFYNSAWPFT